MAHIVCGVTKSASRLINSSTLELNIKAIVDSDSNKHGHVYCGLTIQPFESVTFTEHDQCVISAPSVWARATDKLIHCGVSDANVFVYNPLLDRLHNTNDVSRRRNVRCLIASMPKSGTEWLSHVFRTLLMRDTTRIRGGQWTYDEGPLEVSVLSDIKANGGIGISHLHPSPVNLEILEYFKLPLIVHVRDPEEVVYSATRFLRKHVPTLRHPDLILKLSGYPDDYLSLSFGDQLAIQNRVMGGFCHRWLSGWYDHLRNGSSFPFLITTHRQLVECPAKVGRDIDEFLDIKECFSFLAECKAEKGKHNYTGTLSEAADIEMNLSEDIRGFFALNE